MIPDTTNSNAKAPVALRIQTDRTSPLGGLPVRTNLRAGVGEDALAQVQAWWQNLVNSLTATNSSTQADNSNQ